MGNFTDKQADAGAFMQAVRLLQQLDGDGFVLSVKLTEQVTGLQAELSSLRATRDKLRDLLVEVERLTIDYTPGPGQWSEVKRLANDARAALEGRKGGE